MERRLDFVYASDRNCNVRVLLERIPPSPEKDITESEAMTAALPDADPKAHCLITITTGTAESVQHGLLLEQGTATVAC
jgi:hypothetical protein